MGHRFNIIATAEPAPDILPHVGVVVSPDNARPGPRSLGFCGKLRQQFPQSPLARAPARAGRLSVVGAINVPRRGATAMLLHIRPGFRAVEANVRIARMRFSRQMGVPKGIETVNALP